MHLIQICDKCLTLQSMYIAPSNKSIIKCEKEDRSLAISFYLGDTGDGGVYRSPYKTFGLDR